jgi:hypothetical protein
MSPKLYYREAVKHSANSHEMTTICQMLVFSILLCYTSISFCLNINQEYINNTKSELKSWYQVCQ